MKTITISGINNRYQIKKLLEPVSTQITKKKYDQIINQYPDINNITYQFNIVNDIFNKYPNNNNNNEDDDINVDKSCVIDSNILLTPIEKIIFNEIKIKINNYKSQDVGNKFNTNNIISIISCIELLVKSQNTCFYCLEPCLIVYQNIRYPKQWTLDRINNDIGHNTNNVVIACLQCNLQRKNKNSDKFLQGKQLKLVKIE
jgi:hypothetical protein